MNQFIRKAVSGIILLILLPFSFFAYGESSAWDCPECGRTGNTGNYCGGCAHPAPWIESSTDPAPTDTPGHVSSLPSVKEGYIIAFGTYPQTKEGTDQTPIEWIVLDYDETNHKALLLSKYGLDTKPYNTEWMDTTWEKCSLRTWLNGEFLDNAFSLAEQSAILTTNVDNSSKQGYDRWNTEGSNNTKDQIFLLSYAEANRYLGANDYNSPGSRSQVAPTAYAIAQGADIIDIIHTADGEPAGCWWFRSPGFKQNNAACMSYEGVFVTTLNVNNDNCVVRPAFWLDLESGIF